jgi:hypothetical protein
LAIVKRLGAHHVHSRKKANEKSPIHLLAVLSFGGRARKEAIEQERAEFEQRLHTYLDPQLLVTAKGRKIRVQIQGDFTEDELHHKACGVKRVWEWEAA